MPSWISCGIVDSAEASQQVLTPRWGYVLSVLSLHVFPVSTWPTVGALVTPTVQRLLSDFFVNAFT